MTAPWTYEGKIDEQFSIQCILQLRGVRPFLSDKYDLTQHPNFKLTADYDKRNEFKIEKFLSHRLRLKADDEFVVVDAD